MHAYMSGISGDNTLRNMEYGFDDRGVRLSTANEKFYRCIGAAACFSDLIAGRFRIRVISVSECLFKVGGC